jgi:glycosyltransferase involved in cell wall biosynthesis
MDVAPLTALANELDVADAVEFEFRFVADAELDGLMRSADALLFPYREIEASGVLMAAVAQGRPVIASRLGAFAEIVRDGRHGLLVEPGDSEALARALERAVREPDLLPRLTHGMRELRDAIPSWREISRRTVAVYQAALQARSKRQLPAAGLAALPWHERRPNAVGR